MQAVHIFVNTSLKVAAKHSCCRTRRMENASTLRQFTRQIPTFRYSDQQLQLIKCTGLPTTQDAVGCRIVRTFEQANEELEGNHMLHVR